MKIALILKDCTGADELNKITKKLGNVIFYEYNDCDDDYFIISSSKLTNKQLKLFVDASLDQDNVEVIDIYEGKNFKDLLKNMQED